jgi:hypothetical protein
MYKRSASEHASVPVQKPVPNKITSKASPHPGETLSQFAQRHGTTPGDVIKKNSHAIGRSGQISTDMQLNV